MRRYINTLLVLLISFVNIQCQKIPEKGDKEILPAEAVMEIEKRIAEDVTPGIALSNNRLFRYSLFQFWKNS
jgi:hypothetical protein